jgi:polysaccharide deacetylase 2 family uncharacterized protein YibQ
VARAQRPAPPPGSRRGRRGLIAFWVVILGAAAIGAGYLQYLGPPAPPAAELAALVIRAQAPAAVSAPAPQPLPPAEIAIAGAASAPSRPHGAPIPDPSPKLLAASVISGQWQIPHIALDGATPMQVYAASQLPPPDAALLPPNVPRVAVIVIVAGLGDKPDLIGDATALPPEISLALNPYGTSVQQDAAAARAAGHETLLLLPMPGLLAGAPQKQNQATLDWSMAQFQGYAGVTDAFNTAMGGGFMANPASRNWLLANIARQGLFYIEGDTNAGTPPYAASRNADIVIDASAGPNDETVGLAALITDAESQHSALAIMLHPTPNALRALSDWSETLVNKDILLVPVSALVLPPDLPLPLETSTKQ